VLTVETGKQTTGLLVSAPMLKYVSAETDTHRYWLASVGRYRYRSKHSRVLTIYYF